MNEWDRLHRQAERYKAEYPSGTRIMLLSMGNDIHRVKDNTRGTVLTVDDIGTLHCKFDNGRSLGRIPREVSRKNWQRNRKKIWTWTRIARP